MYKLHLFSQKHEHQPLEGNAGTYGSRAKLAQVYPSQFCQDLAHIILRHLKVKPLDNEVYLLEDIFEPFTGKQVDILRQEMAGIDKEFNMASRTAVRIQGRPFNKNVPPLVISSQLVQKFQRTLKQRPSGTPLEWNARHAVGGANEFHHVNLLRNQTHCSPPSLHEGRFRI